MKVKDKGERKGNEDKKEEKRRRDTRTGGKNMNENRKMGERENEQS